MTLIPALIYVITVRVDQRVAPIILPLLSPLLRK